MNSPPIGNISNLIGKKRAKPPQPPSRIEVLEGRVVTLESALQTVLSELTALREDIQRLKTSTARNGKVGADAVDAETETTQTTKPPKEKTGKPTQTSATPAAKPTETETEPPPPPQKSKSTRSGPWNDPKIRSDLEACRPQILQLLRKEKEITKQGCADALGIDPTLAGRTLSYMMTETNEVRMISPPKTEDDPDPKKRFRRIT